MITYRYTGEELLKECCTINNKIAAKFPSAFKTFKNWVRNNKSGKRIVLSKSTYNILNNTVFVLWVGERHHNVNDISFCFIVRYLNKCGQYRYVMHMETSTDPQGKNKRDSIFIFTNHFTWRLKERLGISFMEWFNDWEATSALHLKTTDLNENREFTAFLNNTTCFGVRDKDCRDAYYITTVINSELEYQNQTTERDEAVEDLQRYRDYRDTVKEDIYSNIKQKDFWKMMRNPNNISVYCG